MRAMKDSGFEWIGEIPEGWKLAPLNKYAVFFNGDRSSKYPMPSELCDEGIVFLTSENLNNDVISTASCKYITEEKYQSLGGAKLKLGDIVFCLRGSVGKCAINKTLTDGTIASSLMVIRSLNLNSIFLTYLLLSYVAEYQINLYMNGTCAANLSAADVSKFRFPIPDLEEQRRIAAYLDRKCTSIDSLISKQQESIEKLKAYKQSVITEAVTKGLDPDVPMKDSGVEWIGEIPEEWQLTSLSALFSERKNKNNGLVEKNLLSLSYGNIIRKNIETKEGLLPESFEGYNIIETGDIVLRLTDLQNDKRSLRTGLCKERGIITSAYITLCPLGNDSSRYMHYLFHSYDICKVFYSMGDGVRQSMKYADLKSLRILRPPLKVQRKIASYLDRKCSSIDALISKKQLTIESLKEYKKSLIYEVVTGKREV